LTDRPVAYEKAFKYDVYPEQASDNRIGLHKKRSISKYAGDEADSIELTTLLVKNARLKAQLASLRASALFY
jgi:hypothetical protein